MFTEEEREDVIAHLLQCEVMSVARIEQYLDITDTVQLRLLCRALNCSVVELVDRIVSEGTALREELEAEKERSECES